MTPSGPRFLSAFLLAAAFAGAQAVPVPNEPKSPATAAAEGKDASDILLVSRQKESLPAPPVDSDGETRSVSPGVAAALALGMPRYNPPKPTPTPTGTPVDMREIDKPKNEIKRLPKYVVVESRPPVFRDRDLFTRQGLIDLSLKSHPGLMFGNILGLNAGAAAQMYQDDERLRNIGELADEAHAFSLGGASAEGRYILQQSQDTYMRSDDGFGPVGGNTGGGGK